MNVDGLVPAVHGTRRQLCDGPLPIPPRADSASSVSETIYNLFLMYEDHLCKSVRYMPHSVDLDDVAATKFLQGRVRIDLNASKVIQLTKPFTVEEFNARCRLGHGHYLYDEVFIFLRAGQQPLSVVTPVVNGVPQIEFASEIGDPDIYLREDMTPGIKMDDWLIKYSEGNTINLPALINDDYFLAIKLTYNAKHYVSSMKLLLSALDSLAYVEYGDANGKQTIFEKWLATYADLTPLPSEAELFKRVVLNCNRFFDA